MVNPSSGTICAGNQRTSFVDWRRFTRYWFLLADTTDITVKCAKSWTWQLFSVVEGGDLLHQCKMLWRRKWQPTPVFLLGKFHRQRSLAGYSPWGCKESDTTETTEQICSSGSDLLDEPFDNPEVKRFTGGSSFVEMGTWKVGYVIVRQDEVTEAKAMPPKRMN